MPAPQQQLGQHGADPGHEHVGLGIPWVALGAEEIHGATSGQQRYPPFDQLVEGTVEDRKRAVKLAEPV